MVDLTDLRALSQARMTSDKMPMMFVGHGNPMNAILDNDYSRSWQLLGEQLPAPKAILCISAHWLTKGTAVTMTDSPKTIHDFGGFPEALFQVQYPAPGARTYAEWTIAQVQSTQIQEDFAWGLDHGAWSVLKNMYPKAAVPVYQMSLDYTQPPSYHFELAKELISLRRRGVLIIASGNVVHNLSKLQFGEAKTYDWAIEFDNLVKTCIEENRPAPLIHYDKTGTLGMLAHPTNDHFLPLMYTLGMREPNDNFSFFNEGFDLGSISMRSVLFS